MICFPHLAINLLPVAPLPVGLVQELDKDVPHGILVGENLIDDMQADPADLNQSFVVGAICDVWIHILPCE